MTMSKEDKEGFIVKFVESKGQKTEYATKAYEVNHTYIGVCFLVSAIVHANICCVCVHCRPLWSCSRRSTCKPSMRMLCYGWTRETSLCLFSTASPLQPFYTARRSQPYVDTRMQSYTESGSNAEMGIDFFSVFSSFPCRSLCSLAAEL